MRYSTISAIGSFTALSTSSTDYLLLDPTACSGGQDAPVRATIEPAPGVDGALIFPPFDDAQIITLSGPFIIRSSSTESGYFGAIDTILASLISAIDGGKTAAIDLTHSGGTVKVWKQAPAELTWQGALPTVTFGLVVDVFA